MWEENKVLCILVQSLAIISQVITDFILILIIVIILFILFFWLFALINLYLLLKLKAEVKKFNETLLTAHFILFIVVLMQL